MSEYSLYPSGQGTSLPNAKLIILADDREVPCKRGVYMWPNGWVTAYVNDDLNQGIIFPPQSIERIYFGAVEDS